MGMDDAADIVPRLMDRTVDHEAGRIDRERRIHQRLAVGIDLDQARRGDLVEEQAVGVDQEGMLVAGSPGTPRRDMGEDQVVPAEHRDQAVGGGEVDPQLPFFGRDLVAQAGDVGSRVHRRPHCGRCCGVGAADDRVAAAAVNRRAGGQFEASCSSRHCTLPEPELGRLATNSTIRGHL